MDEELFILRLPEDLAESIRNSEITVDDLNLQFVDTERKLGVWLNSWYSWYTTLLTADYFAAVNRTGLAPETPGHGRIAKFYAGDQSFNARLLDLPCIVEAQKTRDNSLYVKTGDISQVKTRFQRTSYAG